MEAVSEIISHEPGNLLQALRIRKHYTSKTETIEVLRDCTLTVHRGDFVMIFGPSGCGKTTLLNLLAGIDRPDSGELFFDGMDMGGLNDAELTRLRRQQIGLIFQSFELIPMLTAHENMEVPLILSNLPSDQRRERIETIADLLGIREQLGKKINYMSGGQRQRVAIGRTLVARPRLILGDEISSNLDNKTSHKIFRLFRDMNEAGSSFLIVTHDRSMLQYARRVYHLAEGRLYEGSD